MVSLTGIKNKLQDAREMSSAIKADKSSHFHTRLSDRLKGHVKPTNDYEMRDYHDEKSPEGMARAPTPYYTPYLGLTARLSQVWINKWTVLLLLILVRVLIAIKGLDHDIDSAKIQALSACKGVENVGSAMASMPHYMSTGVNAMAAKSVEVAVEALMGMLMLSVTAVQEIVLFIINLLTSTYVCLITLVVGGAMSAALDIVEKAGKFLEAALEGGTDAIASAATALQTGINDVAGLVDDGVGFVKDGFDKLTGKDGKAVEIPKVDFTEQINNIKAIKLDSDALTADLQGLKDKIPTFDEVHNFTNTMIRTPFQMVKQLINESTIGFKFDQSVFPVAEKQALSFCSDNNGINDFFAGLAGTASTAKKAFLGVVIALAILVCVPMAWREMRRWRKTQDHAAFMVAHATDPMDSIYIGSRPYTSSWGVKVASRFGGDNTRRKVLLRWFVAYITSIPALFVLLLGVAGLISCLFQYILLRQIEQETPALAAQVGAFSGDVVTALTNASEQWAVGANSVIDSTNQRINSDVFGWVNTTTSGVNETLNFFVDGTQKVLNDTFGGTILYNPIQETLRCLIFLKVEGIQKALTWVHDNAHVAFPPFDKDVFSLGAAASLNDSGESQTFLSSPGSEAADDITGAVYKLTDFMKEGIIQEVYISLALIGVYFIIVLVALGRVIVGLIGREKTRGEGGQAFYPSDAPYATGSDHLTGAHRGGLSPRVNEHGFQETKAFENVDETPINERSGANWPGKTQDLGIGKGSVPSGRVRVDNVGHTRAKSSYGGFEDVDEKSNRI